MIVNYTHKGKIDMGSQVCPDCDYKEITPEIGEDGSIIACPYCGFGFGPIENADLDFGDEDE
jgi:hypothetical protein